MRSSVVRPTLLAAWATLALVAAACSSSGGHATGTTTGNPGGAGGQAGHGGSIAQGGGDIGVGGSLNHGSVVSLSIDPPTATLVVNNGVPSAQTFKAIAVYQDQTTAAIDAAAWSATNPSVGSVDGAGVFTAAGTQGGAVTITASYGKVQATATLTVQVHAVTNDDNVDPGTTAALQAASTPDGGVTWAYPYDQMVYPRGVGAPPLMWNGGGGSDVIYVHLRSAGYDLEVFKANVASRYDFDPSVWSAFTQSTSGAAELTVARFTGGAATLLVDQHYTIAPGSMHGTIYYWAINTGRVMRIKPGASAPDDFLGPSVACPSCHTVSANGSHLVMNEGSWPNEDSVTYDLGAGSNAYFGLHNGGGASQWALAGVSADGSVLVQNFAPLRGPIGVATGAFDAVTGAQLPSTGLEGRQLHMPTFSPDDRLLAYVDGATGDLHAFDWDPVAKQATNDRLIVAAGGDPATKVINNPTVSPDHQWIIYQRSNQNGSLGNAADLYLASVAQPGTEVPLANLNGTSYPFAAGSRDRQLNFEPTFAPVAAGGYFWVVFHSRRTFGNALTGPAYIQEGQGVKQLWVAAIDQAPQAGADPSHPAFWLPGQDLNTLNMRGYWALDPCKGDGQGCASGTECCGGYCDMSGDAGQATCKSSSTGCSNAGDHCSTAADCCDKAASCINNVCSEPPPQ